MLMASISACICAYDFAYSLAASADPNNKMVANENFILFVLLIKLIY